MSNEAMILAAPLALVVVLMFARNLFWLALDVVLWVLEKTDGDVQQSEHDDMPEVQAGGLQVGLPRPRSEGVQDSDVLPGRPQSWDMGE